MLYKCHALLVSAPHARPAGLLQPSDANTPAGKALSAGCCSPAKPAHPGRECEPLQAPAAFNTTQNMQRAQRRTQTQSDRCCNMQPRRLKGMKAPFTVELVVFCHPSSPSSFLCTHAATDGINWFLLQRMLITGSALCAQRTAPTCGRFHSRDETESGLDVKRLRCV